MKRTDNDESSLSWLVFLLGCALIMSAPLFYALYSGTAIAGDDYLFHLTRLENLARSFSDGVFPPRVYAGEPTPWGVPTGAFYPSLGLWPPALLRAIGAPLTAVTNLCVIAMFLTAALCAWSAFRLLGQPPRLAFTGAVMYLSLFYFPINAYIRFDLGETAALAFLPLAMAAIWQAFREGLTGGELAAGVFAITGVAQSHILSLCLLAVFAAAVLILQIYRLRQPAVRHAVLGLAGIPLLLNLWFYVPFLVFYRTVPVKIKETFDVFLQSGWPLPLLKDILLRWSPGAAIFLLGALLYIVIDRDKKALRAAGALLLGVLALLLATDLFPWPAIVAAWPKIKFIQFPYRFLILGATALALAAGYGCCRFTERMGWNAWQTGVAALFLCGLHINGFVLTSDLAPGHRLAFSPWQSAWTGSNIDYLYRDADVDALRARGGDIRTRATVSLIEKDSARLSFRYHAERDESAELPFVLYPNLTARDNIGRDLPLTAGENHLATLTLPAGDSAVTAGYRETPLFFVADAISFFTLLSCLAWAIHRGLHALLGH